MRPAGPDARLHRWRTGLSAETALGRGEHITVRGLKLHLRHWGEQHGGVPVVLCHGFLDVGASWQFVAEHLQGRHLIAPDWRGFGLSDWSGNDNYWFPDYVADLDGIANHVSPDAPFDLVGHSMGAQAASLFAGARPDRVRKLVLMDDLSVPDMDPKLYPEQLTKWLDALNKPRHDKTYDDFEHLAKRVVVYNTKLPPERALAVAKAWGRVNGDGRVELLADPVHRLRGPSLFRVAESMAVWRKVTAPTLFLDADESFTDKFVGPYLSTKY